MELRKWVTNDIELQAILEKRGLADKTPDTNSCLNIDHKKVLGVRWNTETDCFYFTPNVIIEAAAKFKRLTKRSFAKIATKIFNPLGFIGPVTLQFKLPFQEIWETKLGWDDQVPSQAEKKFQAMVEDLHNIEKIQIPRMISSTAEFGIKHQELHVFCDASTKTYGAVAYTRSTNPKQIRLVCCKTRAAPLPKNELSLPRLELMSAELGSTLAERIINTIDNIQWEVTLWTDSMATLGWIQGEPARWKLFVRNRV